MLGINLQSLGRGLEIDPCLLQDDAWNRLYCAIIVGSRFAGSIFSYVSMVFFYPIQSSIYEWINNLVNVTKMLFDLGELNFEFRQTRKPAVHTPYSRLQVTVSRTPKAL